ncbi:MAG: DUF5011 domain-containing protein [Mariprofundus sp.]|nr:DUF5011 domain-containing protein [Mariprofundus sp.]
MIKHVYFLLLILTALLSGCGQGGGDATGSVASSNVSVAGTTAVTISINSIGSTVAGGALAPGAVQSASVEAFDANGISIAGPVSANVPNLTITLNVPNGIGITFVVRAFDTLNATGALLFEGKSAPQSLGGAPIVLPIQMHLKIAVTASALSVQPGVVVNLVGTVSGAVAPATSPLLWTATGGVFGIPGVNGATNSWTAPVTPGVYTITANINPAVNTTHNPAVVASVNITVDQAPPVITLVGASPVVLNVGTAYIESGAKALDNIDGNLSAAVVIGGAVNTAVVGTYTITYNVSDVAGNAAIAVTRTVNVVAPTPVDVTPPVITMKGVTPVTVVQGAIYTDAGATASDNVDGNITANIVPTGTVNTAVVGTYTITYNVSDAAGNAAVAVTRTINVSLPIPATPPVVTVPASLVVAATDLNGISGNDPVVAAFLAGATAVNSAGVAVVASAVPATPVQFSIGVTTVTFQATDALGRVGQAVSSITVQVPIIHSLTSNPSGLVPAKIVVDPVTPTPPFTLKVNGMNFSKSSVVTLTQSGVKLPLTGVVQTVVPSLGGASNQVTLAFPVGFFSLIKPQPIQVNVASGGLLSNGVTLSVALKDLVAPTLVSSLPINLGTGVDVNAAVILLFSEEIDAATITATSASLSNLGVPAAGSFSFSLSSGGATIVTFKPSAPLKLNTLYAMKLTNSILDLSGNVMAASSFSFTTALTKTGDPLLLGNLGFELGTFSGYIASGGSTIEMQLPLLPKAAVTLPSELLSMARIDTGTGAVGGKLSSISSGMMSVPLGSVAMVVDVNFLSSEYPRFLGSTFDDIAIASINTINGIITDTITSVNKAPMISSLSGVYGGETGFFPLTFDLTGLAGTQVNIQLSVTDVGDTSVNSALLIDNIHFVPAAVDITPRAQNVVAAGVLQFSAAQIGNSSGALTWAVNGVVGGNAAIGTISATGLYKAPTTLPLTAKILSISATDALGVKGITIVTLVTNKPPVFSQPAALTATSSSTTGLASTASVITSFLNNVTATATVGKAVVTNDAPSIFPIGLTTVTFTATDIYGNSSTVIGTVTVLLDQIAPVVTLSGVSPQTVAQGTLFVDSGTVVTDNIDVGLVAATTGVVNTSVVGTYTLTYNVSDTAGNTALSVVRTVNVTDQTAPVITLLGVSTMSVVQGAAYTDAGATASDNVDGNITANIVPTGAVNTALVGTYTITYNVSDAAGNVAVAVTRTVNVVANQAPIPTAPAITTATNTAASSQVLANDPNAGDTHSYVVSTLPVSGTAVVSATGMVTYTPNANFTGADSLVVTVADLGGLTGQITITVTVAAGIMAGQAPTNGLVAYYPLDANTNDSSTFARTSVQTGAVTQISDHRGVANAAYSFVSTKLTSTGATELSLTQLTLAAWVKINGAGGMNPRIVGVGAPGSAFENYSLILQGAGPTAKLWFYTGGTVANAFSTASLSNDGLWHHVAVSYDGTSARFYIDGALDSTVAAAGALAPITTANINVGGSGNTVDYFNGDIDEVRIYNRMLNMAEITALKASPGNWISTLEDTNVVVTLSGVNPTGNPLTSKVTSLPVAGTLYQTVDGTILGAQITTVPAIVSNANQQVIFVPALNGNGAPYAGFQYVVNDGAVDSAPATVTVNVTPVNDAPVFTGTPAITQTTAVVGSVLSLSAITTSDADLNTVTLSYQWQAAGGAITGATTASYTVVAGDSGKAINCVITANDGTGAANATVVVTTNALSVPASAFTDSDGDGLLDSVETNTGTYVSATDTGTNPNNPDTDGDGVGDGIEVWRGQAPLVANSVYYIDAVNGLDGNAGTTWATAWKTLSKAVATAPAGATATTATYIVAAAGSYAPLLVSFTINKSNLQLVGSVSSTVFNPSFPLSSKIIAGPGAGTLVLVSNAVDVHLTGFDISGASGGNGGVSFSASSGGIHFCDIHGNSASNGGGVSMLNAPSSATKLVIDQNTRIHGNTATQSGGGVAAFGSMDIVESMISNNTANGASGLSRGGGGLLLAPTVAGALITVKGSLISGNHASAGYGGGIYVRQPTTKVTLFNNLVVGNLAATAGGGIKLHDPKDSIVTSNTIAYNQVNSAKAGGGLTYFESIPTGALAPSIHDNILWFNEDNTVDTLINVGESLNDYLTIGNQITQAISFNNDIGQGTVNPANDISINPNFQRSFYLDQTLVSPLGPINAGSATAVSIYANSETDNISGTADAGQLDMGFHYFSGFNLTGATAVTATPLVALVANATNQVVNMRPTVGGKDLGPGHVVFVNPGAAATTGVAISSLTTLRGLGVINSVLAKDNGDGTYAIAVTTPVGAAGSLPLDVVFAGFPKLLNAATVSW